jgi:2-amino-4-hydroxy-6-hydroxymethyldihydropteridine diphosphokinase
MGDMKTAYIGMGTNLGDRRRNCTQAIDLIGQIPACRIERLSGWYLTEPVGVEGQAEYMNGVLSLKTALSAPRLLESLLGIEAVMGRVRHERWEPRIIDLDLLLFGQEIIDLPDLKVPHPRMHLRRFVLVPLVQIAPDMIHPLMESTMAQLLDGLPEDDQVVKAL